MLDEGCERNEGSAKLAIALLVLSLANTAKLNKALRFCLNELVDCRCCLLDVVLLEVRGISSFDLDSRTTNEEDFESKVKGRTDSFTSDSFEESFVKI